MTDPIADMLARIKNAYMANRAEVAIPHSKLKEALAKILRDAGFISEYKVDASGYGTLIVTLKYSDGEPAITQVKRVSTPGKRVYVKRNAIPKVLGGLGVAVLSTPSGLLIDRDAKKQGLGGEVICTIW